MAQHVITKILDDIDQTEGASTITFAYEGVQYEIDLSDKNRTKFSKSMELWIDNARRVGGRRIAPSSNGSRSAAPVRGRRKGDTQAIREWAKAHGHKLGAKGRIPTTIVAEYEAANR